MAVLAHGNLRIEGEVLASRLGNLVEQFPVLFRRNRRFEIDVRNLAAGAERVEKGRRPDFLVDCTFIR